MAGNAKAGENSDDKLIYRASLADSPVPAWRNENDHDNHRHGAGSPGAGAAGKPGQINLPVSVQVVDGDKVIYSQSVSFPVQVPAEGSTQFVFVKNDVAIPNCCRWRLAVHPRSPRLRRRLGCKDADQPQEEVIFTQLLSTLVAGLVRAFCMKR